MEPNIVTYPCSILNVGSMPVTYIQMAPTTYKISLLPLVVPITKYSYALNCIAYSNVVLDFVAVDATTD